MAGTSNSTSKPIENRTAVFRFALLSAVSFILNLALTVFFHEILSIPERFAFIPTIILLTVFNFFASRFFVYTDADGSIPDQFGAFVSTIAVFRLLEYAVYYIFVQLLFFDYRVTILIVAPGFAAAKFFWLRINVFKPKQVTDVG